MTEENESTDIPNDERINSRGRLVWQIFLLQMKLVVDGFRDVILVPISLFAGLLGLIVGGDHPEKYLQKVLSFGRQSEIWINLFGQRKHSGTSDAMIEPIRERVMSEAQDIEWLQRAGKGINKKLDSVNQHIDKAVAEKTGNRTNKSDDELKS